MLTLQRAALAATPDVRDVPGLVLRALDLSAEVDLAIETQAAWRRRGLCRALVHFVCRHAFDTLGLRRLVMCADPHDVAIGIYRSVGFAQMETHWCLQRRARRDRA